MKRTFCFLALVIGFQCALYTSVEAVAVGIKGGRSFASQTASGDVFPGIERPTTEGGVVGLSIEIPLGSTFWLQFEPMYVQKGSEVDWPSGYGVLDHTFEADYVTLPANLKAGLDVGPFRPFLFVGPYIGILLSAESTLKDGTTYYSKGGENDIDFGVEVGGGVDVGVYGPLWITIDARYSLGLVDMNQAEGSTFENHATIVLVGALIEL